MQARAPVGVIGNGPGPAPEAAGAGVAIDLWVWPIEIGADAARALRGVLSPDECARADRFVRERDAIRFTAARARLRAILARQTGQAPEALRFGAGPRGKPFLAGGPSFNLSHSAGWAALAVAAEPALPLGIDIEGPRTVERGVADIAFAPEERAALQATPDAAWPEAFLRGWTRKEAVVKAMGEGLHADLAAFAISLERDAARMLRMDAAAGRAADWRLEDFTPAPGLIGAVAARTDGRAMHLRRQDGALDGA